eukprot:328671-Pyramimonas_sp.AAC.1
MGSVMPPMLKVRTAPQPQPAKGAGEEQCSCTEGEGANCGTDSSTGSCIRKRHDEASSCHHQALPTWGNRTGQHNNIEFDTLIRPAMTPHYTVPGPAIKGPAKPGTCEHGRPIRMKLH